MTEFKEFASGLRFPEGPIAMPDGSVILVEIARGTLTRCLPNGKVHVIAELGDTGVRLLARITGADPGSVAIGDRGTMVLRRVADRSGVPDYGYAFLPDAEVAG